jgi:fructose-bisphosphate aldolase class 1
MQLNLNYDPPVEESCNQETWLAPIGLSDNELRLQVEDLAARELEGRDTHVQIDAIFQTVRAAISDDELITLLVSTIKRRVEEHIDLAIDISAAGLTPCYEPGVTNPSQVVNSGSPAEVQ